MKRSNTWSRFSRQARINDLDQRITMLEKSPAFPRLEDLCAELRSRVFRQVFKLKELRELSAEMHLRGLESISGLDAARQTEYDKRMFPALMVALEQDDRFDPECVEAVRRMWKANGLL